MSEKSAVPWNEFVCDSLTYEVGRQAPTKRSSVYGVQKLGFVIDRRQPDYARPTPDAIVERQSSLQCHLFASRPCTIPRPLSTPAQNFARTRRHAKMIVMVNGDSRRRTYTHCQPSRSSPWCYSDSVRVLRLFVAIFPFLIELSSLASLESSCSK